MLAKQVARAQARAWNPPWRRDQEKDLARQGVILVLKASLVVVFEMFEASQEDSKAGEKRKAESLEDEKIAKKAFFEFGKPISVSSSLVRQGISSSLSPKQKRKKEITKLYSNLVRTCLNLVNLIDFDIRNRIVFR